LISVERVCFWYSRGATVLDDVSLTISDGDVVLLMGENGSGKTTLAKLLNGLLKPKSGRVVVDGLDTREHSVAELCRIVGYVPQNPEHQFFAENAAEEVAFGLRNLGLGDKEALDEALSVLRKFGLERYASTPPWQLSGGEMKRLSIASVYAMQPKYLILDEPTIGQDAKQKKALIDLIFGMKAEGKAVLVITHDVEWASELGADKVVLLSKGKVIAEGVPEDIFFNYTLLKSCNLVPPVSVDLYAHLSKRGFSVPRSLDYGVLAESIALKLGGSSVVSGSI